jgi:hypothetical protein
MSTFSAKGSDIDVEAIMSNIRRRIEEKRKGLYTEDEVREIAEMRLDAVLDSNEFNSDFVAAFRARDDKWNFSFNPETIYASSRAGGGGLIRSVRRWLNPVLKLFFNPNPVISALSRQSDLNRYYVLLLHNMAKEMTQMSLELTNVKARLRTVGIRVDFQTKREKSLEGLTARREAQASSQGSSPSSEGERGRRQRGGRRNYRRRRGGRSNEGRGGGSSGSRDGNSGKSGG